MPIQPAAAGGAKGIVEIDKIYEDGLCDLTGFSHIILIYNFHRSTGFELKVQPFLDNRLRGLFSTRAPNRPNAIGISVVRLISVHENILEIENVDMLDGTPLLDIKPYIPEFDVYPADKTGWLAEHVARIKSARSDNRFK